MSERTDPTIMGNEFPIGQADREQEPTDPAEIRAEIRETRERMGETIEEIGERLNPNRIKEQVKENIRDATIGRVKTMAQSTVERVDDTRQSIATTIRDNPIPAAMIGVGLGWLFWSGRQQGSSRGGQRYAAGRVRDIDASGLSGGTEFAGPYAEPSAAYGASQRGAQGGSGIAENVKETAGALADRAQNVAGSVAQQTRTQTRRVQDQFYENPLAIGTATLALGLAAGLAAPATRREQELLGDARDKLVDRVRNVARETKDKVQHVVDEAQTAARQEGLIG